LKQADPEIGIEDFHDWPWRLPPSVEMGAIQLPGRSHRHGELMSDDWCRSSHIFELCETYEHHPESPLECLMRFYGGLEDHEVEAER
jgi:surfactin synthase thioesterase subunit